MKKLTFICALAILVGVSSVASAGVQSIKVSGDISQYLTGAWYDTFYRHRGTLVAMGIAQDQSDSDNFFATNLGLNFDADLTENVGARLRMVNQRPWDLDDADTTAMDIGIAEAYIVLREMLYEPLTVTIGRQPLYYGRGFIVGSNVIDPEGQVAIYDQYSLFDGFDAIKAEIDYEPWKIDLAFSAINEGVINSSDDIHLWLVNVGYDFDEYNAEMEGYYVGLEDRNRTAINITTIRLDPSNRGALAGAAVTHNLQSYQSHTIGARGSLEPIEDALLFGEVAYQFGEIGDVTYDLNNNITGIRKPDITSWGAELGGEYFWSEVTGEPNIGLCYTYHEGENFNAYGYSQGDYDAFYTPFMRRSDTAIFGHNGRYGIGNTVAPSVAAVGAAALAAGVPGTGNVSNLYYKTGDFANSVDGDDTGWDANLHQILVTGSIKPLVYWDIEDVSLGVKYAWFNFDEAPMGGENDDAGDELDVMLTYDYTEDVQFSLLGAWFWPGGYYDRDEVALGAGVDAEMVTLVEGAVKLTF